jgi:TRAP-type C4-dicarboxylate transport system permease large subunit
MIGLITPPMGLCLFVADSIANVGLGHLTRQIVQLFFVELCVLIVISFFPLTVIGLPRWFGF